jgi:transcriptional regulator with XRE-family HTH domain
MPDTPTDQDPEDVRVGATIKALREAHGLKRTELARAIRKSEPLISAIERGDRHATPEVCRAVADTLGIPLAAITVKDYAQIAEVGS